MLTTFDVCLILADCFSSIQSIFKFWCSSPVHFGGVPVDCCCVFRPVFAVVRSILLCVPTGCCRDPVNFYRRLSRAPEFFRSHAKVIAVSDPKMARSSHPPRDPLDL